MCLRRLMSGASQVALVIKNLPANAGDLGDVGGFDPWNGWEDPLEEGMATCSIFLLGESHGQRSLAGYIGPQRVRHD